MSESTEWTVVGNTLYVRQGKPPFVKETDWFDFPGDVMRAAAIRNAHNDVIAAHLATLADRDAQIATMASALQAMSARFDGVSDGRCVTCRHYGRYFDLKGNIQPCDNRECLSNRVGAALRSLPAESRRLLAVVDAAKAPIRIGIDVGGVLSKYPGVFRALVNAPGVEAHVVSDMHPPEKIIAMLVANGVSVAPERVHSADYKTHGEGCKAVLCERLGLALMIDDFVGYVADPVPGTVRLLVMPDSSLPYYADEWVTDVRHGLSQYLCEPCFGGIMQPWAKPHGGRVVVAPEARS